MRRVLTRGTDISRVLSGEPQPSAGVSGLLHGLVTACRPSALLCSSGIIRRGPLALFFDREGPAVEMEEVLASAT